MKRYFLIIGLIFIFIIVAIVVATNMQSNDTNDEFFAYVKDNSLILWNERNNEKIVLNSNFDSSKEMFLDIHFAYSFDKTKIIYPYNISDNSVGLRYVDINNISEENSQLIDDGVLLYEIVKNGLVYIKDMNLYYYDFNDKQMIAENITAYAVSNDKNTDRIINYLTQTEMEKLRTELQSAQFQLSQLSQTSNIVNQLMPVAKPAYITCSPYAAAFGTYNIGCGCNTGCGCC